MTVGVVTRRYQLDGVVTTLDLTNADRTLDTQPEALKQAAIADCLLLTKSDLADPAAILSLEQRLLVINPSARRLRSVSAGNIRAPRLMTTIKNTTPATITTATMIGSVHSASFSISR